MGFSLKRNKGRKRRALAALVLLAIVCWSGGLLYFITEIPDDIGVSPANADAIVVLTGGSMRLETGLSLLNEGRGRKLFVSGVHRGVDVAELMRVSRQSPEKADCCIALGYDADHTRGNAEETARWIRGEGYGSLVLVTADYHMPRSLLEFSHALPEARIMPYPVFPEHVKTEEWYRWPGTALLIIGEYNKYLVAPLRWMLSYLMDGQSKDTRSE